MMKILISNKNLIAFILVATLFLGSCRNGQQENFNRAVEVFFLGVLQVINMIFFGTASLILCIISGTNPKQIFKVLGGVFLGLFSLFALIGFVNVIEANPRENDIFIIFLMEFAMIIVSMIFVFKKPKATINPANNEKYLDKIIDEKDEVI